MIVVSNASPLISLAKIDSLFILQTLFGVIHITNEVRDETYNDARPGGLQLRSIEWLIVHDLLQQGTLEKMRIQYPLGKGEISTILLAKELKADLVIIDGRKARGLAKKEGLMVTGTIGILEIAQKKYNQQCEKLIRKTSFNRYVYRSNTS